MDYVKSMGILWTFYVSDPQIREIMSIISKDGKDGGV